MESQEVKEMRRKQIVVTNSLILLLVSIMTVCLWIFPVTIFQMQIFLAALMFGLATVRMVRRNSTYSIIPLFEKVAKYEKQKMGEEWRKQQLTGVIGRYILGVVLVIQSYLNRNTTEKFMNLNLELLGFMLTFIFFFLIILNVSLFFHIRKVDRAKTEADLKGYNLLANLIGIGLSVFLLVGTILVTIWLVL
ncbi:hypothetical protein Q75_09165 [Bacillus coahuilensis p1.1.43]|uniref:Uncharacterized protein n=1 Tax=Bacillus coahuilensis p1.1.43 TaxID=1150625 RepID=A0A147K819_9BACI|nr:hypothetical protein [Bacillus coahuilensis]KUP06298.1 hypothetical protein Q75_09165 [Bacillus coahuilensis p1.1.43]